MDLVQNSRVKEHYVVDINLKCVMKLSVKTAIIVLAIWNAFGRTGANGVIALQSVAMDIVLGTDVFWIDFLIRETWTKMKFHPKPMIFIN